MPREGGEYQETLNYLTSSAEKCGNLLDLIKSSPRNSDKVKLCYSDPLVHTGIGMRICLSVLFQSKKLSKLIENKAAKEIFSKNAGISNEYRLKGNTLYTSDLAVAQNHYTKALFYAPHGSQEELTAFGNRSSVMFDMGKFEECISDVDNAVKSEEDVVRVVRLLNRKVDALLCLGQVDEAKHCLERSKRLLNTDHVASKKRSKLEKAIESVEAKIEEIKIGEQNSDSDFRKEFADLRSNFRTNPDFPFASEALAIKSSLDKGRHVVATKDIKTGDVLFIEKPFAFVCLPDTLFRHCHHCCKRIFNPYPCEYCAGGCYCSRDCRLEAWDLYHRWECGLGLDVSYSVGIGHLGLRVALVGSVLQNKEYDRVIDLLDHIDELDAEDLYQYTLVSVLFLIYLESRTKFFATSKDRLFEFGGLLLKHIAQLVSNGHALSYCHSSPGYDQIQEEEEIRVGTGIFPSASMMNHSCDPTIMNSFFNQFLIVKAIKNVSAGSEVYNCYGPHFQRMPRKERQESLAYQYKFNCVCAPCSEPVDFIEKFTAGLMCPNCGAVVVRYANNCSACDEIIASWYWDDLNQAERQYHEAKELLSKNRLDEARTLAEESMNLRSLHLYENHKSVLESKDLVAMIHARLGNYLKCFRMLEDCITGVQDIYGENSVELASEILKMSNVVTQACLKSKGALKNREALDRTIANLKKAETILSFHYCHFNSKYVELTKSLEFLTNLREKSEDRQSTNAFN